MAEILADVGDQRPLPQRILDDGTEFTSKALDVRDYWNQVKLDFSRRGKPQDNAHIEAFNSLVRRECLSQHWFSSLEEVCGLLEAWKEEYNNDRPHGSLRQMTPQGTETSPILTNRVDQKRGEVPDRKWLQSVQFGLHRSRRTIRIARKLLLPAGAG